MLNNEEEAKMVRTNTEGPSGDLGTKIRAFVATTKTTKGRYPSAEEMSAFGGSLGIECSIAPNLAGRAAKAAPVTRAAAPPNAPPPPPPVPVVSKTAPAATELPAHYREPEPMPSEERAAMFHARTKDLRAEGVESMRAARLAFRYAYGDQVPASDLVENTYIPPTMTPAEEADRDRRFRALIAEKKQAGKHTNTARSEAFRAVYGDLYANAK